MKSSNAKVLQATRFVGATLLTIGIAIFIYGYFVSDYTVVAGIGIGTVMGSVFIFLMGVFFAATEEMLERTNKDTEITKTNR